MHPFRSLYDASYDFPSRSEPPEKTYFLSAIPRVGSTFFAIELWKTAVLGAPLEYLNLTDREDTITQYGKGDVVPYWNNVMSRRTSSNGVFGSKLFTKDIHDVFDRDADALSVVRADYLIHLRRHDILQQAISYSRARQSKIWIPGGALDNLSTANYDFGHISDAIRAIKRQQDSWDKIAKTTGANCLTLFYEDFDRDPTPSVERVLGFLGVTSRSDPLTNLPIMARQRDALSTEWKDRYHDDLIARRLVLEEIE